MKPAIILLSFLFVHLFSSAQPFASWKGNQLILNNGVVRRELVLEGNKIITRSLKLKGDDLNFDTGESGEFSFALNDAEKGFPVKMERPYDGKLYEIEMITPYSLLRKLADY